MKSIQRIVSIIGYILAGLVLYYFYQLASVAGLF